MPATRETVAIELVRGIVRAAPAVGLTEAELLRCAGCTPDELGRDDVRIPRAAFDRLWSRLAEVSDDVAVGVLLARQVGRAADSWVAQLALLSDDLAGALAALVRFFGLFAEGETIHARQVPEGLELEVVPRAMTGTSAREACEFALARIVLFARQVVGREIVPARVTTRGAARAPSTYAEVFGTSVTFEQRTFSVTVRGEHLALPSVRAEPRLRKLVEERVRSIADRMPRSTPTASRVRGVLAASLPLQELTLATVAKVCALSERTLQRRLREEGTSFAAVVDDLRYALARDLLSRADCSIGAVAFELGFATHAAFHAAFVRWAAETPGQFRKSALATSR